MNKYFKFAAAAATAFAFISIASTASAGGFLGDLINNVAPGVGTQLDNINGQLGNPVDHAAARVADAYVPGSGAALEAGWAVQRSGVFSGPGAPPPAPAGFPGQGFPPPPFAGGQQFPVGGFCGTPVGRFGPGPIQPLGAPCFANGPFGPVPGQIVQ